MLDEVDAGIAASSVHRHYRTLHRVLEVAVKHKRIAVNPCAGVQPPTVPRRRMVILDWPQVFELADALPARYRALIFLAVNAGMRWSELVGLAPITGRREGVQGRGGGAIDPPGQQ